VVYLLVGPPLFLRPRGREEGGFLGLRPKGEYLAEFEVPPGSGLHGRSLAESPVGKAEGVEVVALVRHGEPLGRPAGGTLLAEGDQLLAHGPREEILRLGKVAGLRLRRDLSTTAEAGGKGDDPEANGIVLVEAFVPAGSPLDGRTLEEAAFQRLHRCAVLAIRHRQHHRHERIGVVPLSVGDVLMVQGRRRDVDALRGGSEVVPIEEVAVPHVNWRKALRAMGVLAAVVTLAAMDLAPVLLAALGGCLVLAISGVLSMEKAYAAIDGKTILLLAGVIPLGLAMEKSGAALLAGAAIEDHLGPMGPEVLIAGTFLLSAVLTNLMSNTATAALLVPPALAAAQALGIDPRPLLVAVTFGASTSFMTPVGYQTNAMVLGPGGYRFWDFVRIGGPLNLIFCLLAAWAIPRHFPPG